MDWDWPADQGRRIKGGKTLGGSTSINGGAYTRGLAAQYDAWSSLLSAGEQNLGWNWASLFSYMKKSETFSAPNSQQAAKGAQSTASYHGTSGPVQVTFPDQMYGGPQQPAFVQTIKKTHNVSLCPDLNGGAPNCVSYTPLTIDWHRNGYRSSSAEAYLTPVQERRKGWTTLVEQQVTKILFQSGSNPAVATGVQFGRASGSRYTAYARKEVILAAGAINTPALMQLSGIGDPSILSSLGISTVVNLPTVGKNLQEQTMNSLGAKSNGFDWGGRGPSNVIAFPNLYQVFGSQGASVASQIQSNVTTWANSQAANGGSASALQKIFQVQADLITKQNAPIVELFYNTGYPSDLGISMWPLLPFSRGRVQIESTDPFLKPKVTVNYFSVGFDLQCQIAGARMARKILGTTPLSGLSTGEVIPGKSTVPDNGSGGSDADWTRWIKSQFFTVSHPVGSCAMMAPELGGCVDGRLRVYGTKNLRVVDASVMPTQVSAHLMSTLYGMAEKASISLSKD
ncbi:Glucose oxidase OS=Aspergillus niger GN=gox PE=1 SV=1 [Rhizoctonia solani AG-1 IB]|uniref:Glucose oxidase n=1 Tax=Thanatephorus cucumeris (strain AG1-IB / isolate 7/3/14) TaxID=1108050 RepID=A0A0B7FBX8_THACB|nr:Glucose oxidase OS=Aspergillus niger GN=gox PE=1 SV=1 [Rhizoctonia solani AG-1 IB]